MKDLIRKMWVKFFEERGRRERLQKAVISMVLIAAVVSVTVFVAVTPAHTLETEGVLGCGKEEHVHDENCFTEQAELVCGLEESAEEHTHTEDCYETESVLTCTLEEHTHGAECYVQSAEKPEESFPETPSAEENSGTEDIQNPEDGTGVEEVPEGTEEGTMPPEGEEMLPPEGEIPLQEETPEEEEQEEDVEYSVTLEDGLVITMTGPADAFPEETLTMRAVELHEGDADYEAALSLLAGETEDEVVLEQRIFDICLLDEDGNEVQPEKEVTVTFSQVLNGEEHGVQIHHLDMEENVAERIESYVDGDDVSMETGHFSYYSMTRSGSGAATIGENSYQTLAAAVAKVQNGETIVLQEDIAEDNIKVSKSFTIDVNGHTWTGNSYDMLTFSTNNVSLTLTGGEAGGTLQAGSNKRIITISSKTGCTLDIINLKLQGNGTIANGGILYAVASADLGIAVRAEKCEFTGGHASAEGGALYIQDSSLIAEGCTFEGNEGVKSGAVCLWAKSKPHCSASFTDCYFLNNKVTTYSRKGGGAINAASLGSTREVTLHLDGCEFTENTSVTGEGGAVSFSNSFSKPSEKFTILNTTFLKNHAEKKGGAVYIDKGPSEIKGTKFQENSSLNGEGGGLHVAYNTEIQDTEFTGNQAIHGGAIGTSLAANQTLSLSGVTAKGNAAEKNGGAVWDNANYTSTALKVTDCRMEGNTAGYSGGAIWTASATVDILGNTVITGNTARAEESLDFGKSAGGIYLKRKGVYTLADTAHVYKNQTPNIVTGGGPVEIFIDTSTGTTLKGLFEGNTVTDAGSVYILAKATDDRSYYNKVTEPERIYLDPAHAHTHGGNDFVADTLKEAVEHAKETQAEKIYVCSPVSIAAGDENNLNTEETIIFIRCDENRNYLFQVKSGDEVTFEKTRISGALVEADYALVLVASGATLNIKGDTVIEAGKNVNPDGPGLGGGGLRVSGTLNMSGGTIQKNQSNGSGGGIHAQGANLNFTGGNILSNKTVEDGEGGGIYVSGGILSITKGEGGSRTLIKDNISTGEGGGISLKNNAKATIYCADILNNASKMVTIWNGKEHPPAYACGGGINVWKGSSLKMKNLYVTDNYMYKTSSGISQLSGAVYSCDTGDMAIFEMEGAFIADNKNSYDIHSEEIGKNTCAYISSHVLGGSDANWSGRKETGTVTNKLELWGVKKSFMVYSNPQAGAGETARAMAASDGVVMTGNWSYGYGSAIANNGTLIVGTEEMSLTVNKVWKDVNGNVITDTSKYEEVPENLRVSLMKSLEGRVPELATEFTDAEVKLNKGNQWSHTWEHLGDSEAVQWSVEENKDDAAGFTAEISEKVQDTSWPNVVQKHYIITITNTEKSEIDIAVEKDWIDKDNANGWRPEEITVELWRSGNDTTPFKTQTLNADNQWFCKFDKLPKYDASGTKYVYSVKELPVEDYTTEISGPQTGADGTTYTITNTAYGKAQIQKTLDGYNETLGGAMFVFDVKATLENNVIFNDVFTADFKAPGTKIIDIGAFPVGTKITVEEIYSGSSYSLSAGDKIQNLTIQMNPEGTGVMDVLAKYTNTYDDKLIPGAGVRNHYEQNENGGWKGSQAAD